MTAHGPEARPAAPRPPEGERFATRYPGYDVLDKWASPDWDEQTRAVVRRRLAEVPPIRFFTGVESTTLEAVAGRIVPQPDRAAGDRVPIVPWVDEKLHNDWRDGYRYEEMPPQREAWRLGLAGIDESARLLYGGRGFAELDPDAQDEVLRRLARGAAPGAVWERLPARRFFRDVLCITVVKAYYAHPRAWSEIGYSGPSSPRGHVRNWMGGVDPWDAEEPGG
ncbi:MAG TPA: gluconate 2-dehydrogenase subunit 3 family protein [Gemmatimonadaceae bacterium]|nr:gluconate 2-dehydrogenase subunit 3 family protein [Gemmatimonadaceae bacterium]